MDDFDDSVTSVESKGNSSKLPLIAVAVGIIGIVVGLTGIVLANKAQTEVEALEARLAAKPDQTEDLKNSIASIEDRLVKLGGEFVKLSKQDRQIQEGTQAAFDSMGENVRANREAINEVAAKLTEVMSGIPKGRVASVAVSTDSAAGAPTEVAEDGIYAIKSGDTLSKVAKQFGVSLNALLSANPTVNPRALQIGQKIVIPQQ